MAANRGYSNVEPISRKFLKEFFSLRLELRVLRGQIADLEEIYAPVAVWSDMPKAQGGTSDKVGDIVAKKDELRREYMDKLHELLEKEELVQKWSAKLNAFDRAVVYGLYFEGKSWLQVAEELGTKPDTIGKHLRKLCAED